MIEIMKLLVIPALGLLLGMYIKQGREHGKAIQALQTARADLEKHCNQRGKWMAKVDGGMNDNRADIANNATEIAVLKSRLDN